MSDNVKYGAGSHLLLDLHGCLPEKLTDVSFIDDVLRSFPAKLGISKPGLVNVFKYQGPVNEDWGVSGIVLANEAHISIHTFPNKSHVFIDIFTCHEFDIDLACDTLNEIFQASEREVNLLDQGLNMARPGHHPLDAMDYGQRELASHTVYQ